MAGIKLELQPGSDWTGSRNCGAGPGYPSPSLFLLTLLLADWSVSQSTDQRELLLPTVSRFPGPFWQGSSQTEAWPLLVPFQVPWSPLAHLGSGAWPLIQSAVMWGEPLLQQDVEQPDAVTIRCWGRRSNQRKRKQALSNQHLRYLWQKMGEINHMFMPSPLVFELTIQRVTKSFIYSSMHAFRIKLTFFECVLYVREYVGLKRKGKINTV